MYIEFFFSISYSLLYLTFHWAKIIFLLPKFFWFFKKRLLLRNGEVWLKINCQKAPRFSEGQEALFRLYITWCNSTISITQIKIYNFLLQVFIFLVCIISSFLINYPTTAINWKKKTSMICLYLNHINLENKGWYVKYFCCYWVTLTLFLLFEVLWSILFSLGALNVFLFCVSFARTRKRV